MSSNKSRFCFAAVKKYPKTCRNGKHQTITLQCAAYSIWPNNLWSTLIKNPFDKKKETMLYSRLKNFDNWPLRIELMTSQQIQHP